MAYNLFIAYDLNSLGQNYDAVRDKIKSLGSYHQFQYSFFYVHTALNARDAYAAVISVMDINDKLAVIDANAGMVSTGDKPPIDAINAIWHKP